jgi:hypothetical protein
MRSEPSFKSALDDDDSEDSADYTDSDDNTYEEGTMIQSLGTFEDAMADMNAEEALAFAMEAAKKMEEDGETVEKSVDTEEFDKQMAAMNVKRVEKEVPEVPEVPEMEGTDSSGSDDSNEDGSSGDDDDESDDSSGSDSSSGDDSNTSDGMTSDASSIEEDDIPEDQSYHTAGTAGKGLLTDPTEFRRQLQIRQEVEDLVRELVPEEVENLDAMFVQFAGREEELLSTLHTMRERRAKVRARAAIHKSRARPPPRMQEDPGYRRTPNVNASSSDSFSGSQGSQQGSNLRASSIASGRFKSPSRSASSSSTGSSLGSSSSGSGSSSSATSSGS